MNRFDIVEAHAVLEWDFNVGGWLQERPSNQRRRQATSVQLSRMRFRPRPNLAYRTLSEEGRQCYLDNVLRWNLPRDDELNRDIRQVYGPECLRTCYPSVHAELFGQ